MNRFLTVASAAFLTALMPVSVMAANSVVVVNPAHMNGWGFFNDNGAGVGSGKLVNGPGTPPIGTGSGELSVADASAGWIMATGSFAGTQLSNFSRLDYSSYSKDNATLAPALQFDIDYSSDDTNTKYQGRLVYEPYMSTTITPNVWETRQTLTGKWWASKTLSTGSNGLCPQSAPCTWDEVKGHFPTASVRGAMLFKAGSGWTGGAVVNFDKLVATIAGNTTTYDFEAAPTTKADCKNGGFATFSSPSFRNQGECVNYIQKQQNDQKHKNSVKVTNQNNQSASSGNATTSGNSNGGSATSGDASNSNSKSENITVSNF